MLRWYAALGGGIGDCVYHCVRDRPFCYLPHLARLGHRIRVITQCHCDAVADLFKHNPFVHEHVCEPWNLPSMEETLRLNNPIDGYLPLQNPAFLHHYLGYEPPMEQPRIWLSRQEEEWLASLCSQHPLIVMQPYAGLSDRDGFDPAAIERMVNDIVSLNDRARIIIVGKNHERGHKYAQETVSDWTECHPNVVMLIDRISIRVSYHLVLACDAFIGCHSNLIRTAWDGRKRNVCVMPDPLMTSHLVNLDRKYTYGFDYPETLKATYPFEQGGERKFQEMDTMRIARWVLGIG